jgi:GT2 family glycosyltransferase
VVVSTFNRADRLPHLVAALEAQQDVDRFEVVIVDDCSTDDTWSVLQTLASNASIDLRLAQTPANGGPARGRNVGWRLTSAPLIAFTDDDCAPASTWLATLAAALETADVVQGCTMPDPVRAPGRGPFAHTMIIEEESGLFETCNIGYRRTVLERLSGFDESFPLPFGEDVDLGWRAVEAGSTIAWQPDALVVHDVAHTTVVRDWVALLRNSRRRRYAPRMVERHPGLRARMHRHWFLTPAHPPTLLALTGVALVAARPSRARRWVIAGALAVPWIVYRAHTAPLQGRRRNYPVLLPMGFVADVAEVAAVVEGSLRYRTILL